MHPGVARRVRVRADRADLEAERRAVQQPADDSDRRERDEQAQVARSGRRGSAGAALPTSGVIGEGAPGTLSGPLTTAARRLTRRRS